MIIFINLAAPSPNKKSLPNMKACILKISFELYGVCLTLSTSKNSPHKILIYFIPLLTHNLEATLSHFPKQMRTSIKHCNKFSLQNIWRWIEEEVLSNNYRQTGGRKWEFIGISCSTIQKVDKTTIDSFRKREQLSKDILSAILQEKNTSYFKLLISRNKIAIL